jgi:hypothetical protein
MNDIEDIHVKNLFCIVGHPNLSKYVNVIDPLFNENTLKEFLAEIARCDKPLASWEVQPSRHRLNNRQNISDYEMPPSDGGDANASDNANDDFHLYEFRDILLDQKEKLSLPVLDIEVPYKDFYHCTIDPNERSTKELMSKTASGERVLTVEV